MSSAVAGRPRETAAPAVLEVRALTHAFGEREVLRGMSFDVEPGEVFGLLGPNGSGKSTALAVLAGLRGRQGGEILFRGRAVDVGSRAMREQMGVVFQSPSVDSKLTGRQNLRLAAKLLGYDRRETRRRTEDGLERAGLLDRGDDLVSEYSGGMKRRLDLARALIHEPSLLLMDEPTAGLDEAAFRETWTRLDAMRDGRELTVLLATHRPDEAGRCDRLGVLADGRVATVETPQQLQSRLAHDVVALRAGDPEKLRARVAEVFTFDGRIDGEEVLFDTERGHELIPRLVEGLPEGMLRSVSLRRPTLADAFFKIVGQRLDQDLEPARPEKGRGRSGRKRS